MARPRKRVRLEDGLKLDVNKLVRQGFWPRGNEPLTFSTQWTSNHRGVITNAQSAGIRWTDLDLDAAKLHDD